jgi:hypothetical protein
VLPLVTSVAGLLNAARRERRDTALLMITTIIARICAPVLIWRFRVLGACLSLLLRQGLGAAVRLPMFLTSATRRQSETGVVAVTAGMMATSDVTSRLYWLDAQRVRRGRWSGFTKDGHRRTDAVLRCGDVIWETTSSMGCWTDGKLHFRICKSV